MQYNYAVLFMTLYIALSVLLLFVSGAYLVGSLSLEIGSMKHPGPGLVPVGIAIFFSIMAILYVTNIFLFKVKSGGNEKESFFSQRDFYLRTIGMIACICFYGIFLKMLGYVFTTIISVGSMLYLLETRNWVQIFLISILSSGVSYYVFCIILEVPLPQGIFP